MRRRRREKSGKEMPAGKLGKEQGKRKEEEENELEQKET